MKKNWYGLFLAMIAVFVLGNAANVHADPMLKMVQIEVDSPGAVKKLASMGIDIAAVRKSEPKDDLTMGSFRVEAVVSEYDQKKLNIELKRQHARKKCR